VTRQRLVPWLARRENMKKNVKQVKKVVVKGSNKENPTLMACLPWYKSPNVG
jgi:hypothetical protein